MSTSNKARIAGWILSGLVATHLRVGDAFVFPIIIGVLIWIALGLRRPKILALAKG